MELDTVRPGVVIVNDGSGVSVSERRTKLRPKTWWQRFQGWFSRAPLPQESTRTDVLIENERPSAARLTLPQREDRDALVAELKESPVIYRSPDEPMIHEVFFCGEDDWDFPFKYFRAIWSEREEVVVFYAWGLGSMFLGWTMFQPELSTVIRRNRNEIVVVVFAVEPYDAELGMTLDRLRKTIWKHFFR